MDRQKYEEMKIYLEKVRGILKEGNLSPEEKDKFELISSQLAGALFHPWLPIGWERQIVMAILLAIGVVGFIVGYPKLLFLWLALPLFSPRLVGETLRIIGMISGGKRGQ